MAPHSSDIWEDYREWMEEHSWNQGGGSGPAFDRDADPLTTMMGGLCPMPKMDDMQAVMKQLGIEFDERLAKQ